MALQQSIDLALASNIGENGIPRTALDAGLVLTEKALKRLREDDETGRLPLLHMPRTTDDLGPVREAAAWLRQDATDVVFLGTGGSSLGGQTLAQLKDYAVPGAGRFTEAPRVHFLDNLDPITFDHILHRLPLASTRFVSISKSGGTGETLMQTIAVLSALDKAGLRARPSDLFFGISEPRKRGGKNALRDLLEPEGVRFLEHHTGHRRTLFRAHQCGPAPGRRARPRHRRHPPGRGGSLRPDPQRRGRDDIPAALGAALSSQRRSRERTSR